MYDNPFYHGIIKKTIIAFGSLFSGIQIERKKNGSIDGETVQRIQVPIAYAPKEKWLVRIEQDPSLENYTYTVLPRMSFEVTNYTYDHTRKLIKTNKVKCYESASGLKTTYTPVPYNLTMNLYVISKTQEDAMQIVEQILPTFGPEYTLTINAIPSMNIKQDIPIILNQVAVADNYDGSFQERRFVVYTLTFQAKLNLYSEVDSSGNVILKTFANITSDASFNNRFLQHQSEGDLETGEITQDEWISLDDI